MKTLTFRAFIELLPACGELHTVTATVDPLLEIAAITTKACQTRQNKALLFEAVKGCDFRVLTNGFGSERRICLALGVARLAELTDWFDRRLENLAGTDSAAKLQALTTSPAWRAAAPELCEPPSYLRAAALDLGSLPLIKNQPLDGQPDHDGKFMTLPLVITANHDLKEINCGMYRAALIAPDTLAIKWSSTSGAALHAASWALHSRRMPMVIALGCSAAVTLAATLPLPAEMDELTFAGLLQGEPLRTFRCANGLSAPSDAEIIIEGYLEDDPVPCGAFANHTGFYSPSEPAAAMKVTSLKIREKMIFPAAVVGKPPTESCWLARAGGFLLLSLLKLDVPQVTSLHQPFAGIFHGAVFISVKNSAGNGLELITAIRRTPWFAGSRLLVIVTEKQDPADEAGVLWRIMNCVNWEEDMLITDGKLSINATGNAAETRAVVEPAAAVTEMVERRWKEYGFDE